MEEDFKKFKVSLDYVDAEGNLSVKDFTISVTNPKREQNMKITYTKYYDLYSMMFSLVLPEHIHKLMVGATVGSAVLYGAVNREERRYDKDFSKTVKSLTLRGLTEAYTQILYDYRWLKQIEDAELTKVIFYSFKNNSTVKQSSWDGTKLGKSVTMNYMFSIGYYSKVDDKEYRYSIDKKLINQYRDNDLYVNYKRVDWTSEREIFFTNIESSFIKLIDQLTAFESNLTEDKIEALISSSPNLLGA